MARGIETRFILLNKILTFIYKIKNLPKVLKLIKFEKF